MAFLRKALPSPKTLATLLAGATWHACGVFWGPESRWHAAVGGPVG